MRILQVIDSLNRGGAEVMLASMVPLFKNHGVACDVAVLQDSASPLARSLLEQGVNVHYTSARHLYSFKQIKSLAGLLEGYDLAHVHLFPAQLWGALAAGKAKSRIPLVTTEHSTWNTRRRWGAGALDRWMYARYKRIACISEATAQSLIAWCPSVKEKIVHIPNGIPLEIFRSAAPAELPEIPPDTIRLVFTGRCDSDKDHATLLRAMPRVPGVHLILIGGGPLRPQLERMAQDLGIRDRISFLGWREDVASILKASNIYVHSAPFEGFGLAACEAMAAGLPVVATDIPGLAQVVAGAGVLFPRGDYEQLARCLNDLIRSPDRRLEMARASRERAAQFSIENTVNGYVHMYKSVLQMDGH